MRAAIYDRFWHSQGGGERHSGMIGQVLSEDGVDVDLIGHTPVDKDELGDHLGLDLSRVHMRVVPDAGDRAMAALSADYDLWVNGSYMSRLRPRSTKAAYLCYFPTPFDADLPPWQRAVGRTLGPLLTGHEEGLLFGLGWFAPEGGHRRSWRWTSDDAVLVVPRSDTDRVLRMELGGPGIPGPVELRVEDETGRVHLAAKVDEAFSLHRMTVPAAPTDVVLRFRTDTFVPGPGDPRALGVAVSRMRLEGSGVSARQRTAVRYPWLLRTPKDLSFLDSYDAVLANSEFTRSWIARLWKTDADVLFPPIQVQRLHPAPVREKAVITVGRFFAPGLGHAKRQREMVEFFRAASAAGRLPGWKMYVVGGMEESQRRYVEEVRRAGAGAPVEVLTNAPRRQVERLLATSAVFWSATGYGEQDSRAPWTGEHFGMTTVEAMAGGCVPVVIDRAGQREIVREDVDGFRWTTPEQLIDRTVEVADDEALRARLAASAVERAQDFSEDTFAERWHGIVAKHALLG